MNTAFYWYLQNAITTALLVPCILLACRAFRDRPAVQHALWLIVLIKFMLPPLVWWPWQLDNLWQLALSFFAAPQVTTSFAPATTVLEPPATSLIETIIPIVFILWLIGALVLAATQLRKIKRQSNLIKDATVAPITLTSAATGIARQWGLAPIPVLIVRGIASPFLWCLGRLKLIWPQKMLSDQLSPAIIAHELAHLRRRDHWIAWLEMAAAVLWWWNPIFWIVRKNLRSTSEMACDALALAAFPDGRCEYAETLLELSAVSKSGVPALVLGVSTGTPTSFERRMSMIISERVSGKLSLAGILLAGFLALVSLPAWTYGQDGGDDTDARKLAELKLKIAQEHLDLLKQKTAQDGAAAKQKGQAEAEQLVAVIYKLARAAHQGDEDAANKLAAIHAKLAAAWQLGLAAKPGKTYDPANLVTEADEALRLAATKKTMLRWLAQAAQQGDEGAAMKLARVKLEAEKKMQADAANQNTVIQLENADSAKQNTVIQLKNIEADIKKLQMMKKQLEDAKKNSDPVKP